jgi:aldehyde:ferredoxin oxidoreductase
MVMDSIITLLVRGHRTGIFTDENTGLPLAQIGSLEFIEALAKKISFREGIGDILAQGTTRAAKIIGQGAAELIGDQISIADHGPAYCPRMYITTGIFYATEPRQPIQTFMPSAVHPQVGELAGGQSDSLDHRSGRWIKEFLGWADFQL